LDSAEVGIFFLAASMRALAMSAYSGEISNPMQSRPSCWQTAFTVPQPAFGRRDGEEPLDGLVVDAVRRLTPWDRAASSTEIVQFSHDFSGRPSPHE
jgi:hypothetical protein